MTPTTSSTAAAEVQGLLRLALEHARRTARTPWLSLTLRGTKIAIRVIRSFDTRVQVWLAPQQGAPTEAQVKWITKALGLKGVTEQEYPLFGNNKALLLESTYYDVRHSQTDPYPSPV